MKKLLPIPFFLLFFFSAFAQSVLYVKSDAAGTNNGTSWQNAYTDLQNAIAAANYGSQIWVAVGTYKPTVGTDRNARFELPNGVQIHGGFLGTETALEQRDYIHNHSILSGDIGILGDSTDNVYTVVYSAGTDENTVLEGFIIEHGNADYSGADAESGDPRKSGGGIYLTGADADLRCQIKHCKIRNNFAVQRGGGIYVTDGGAGGSVRPVLFADSLLHNTTGGLGGGLSWFGGTFAQTENIPADSLILHANTAISGGGIYYLNRESDGTSLIRNCIFAENQAQQGGGLRCEEQAFAAEGMTVEGCQFLFNEAEAGGGIYNEGGLYEYKNFTVTGCFFDHNNATGADGGGGIYLLGYIDSATDRTFTLTDTEMNWGTANHGGGVYADVEGALNIEVQNSVLQFNAATLSGGGIYTPKPEHILRVSNSYLRGNAANDATGGGIHVQSDDVKVVNSVFNANNGKTGGGIRMINGEVINCIFYQNTAVQQGAGIRCRQPLIANCIFWDNDNFGLGQDVFNNSFPLTLYSCLFSVADCSEVNYANSNLTCDENSLFALDPLFDNPAVGDFSVAVNSPVRDAGANEYYNSEVTTDYFGNPRFEGAAVDLGVYEIPALTLTALTSTQGDCTEESISTGAVTYTTESAVTPLTVTVNGQTYTSEEASGTIGNLPGGTYTLTVTDALGNSDEATVFVPFLPQPTVSTELTPPTCSDFTNGIIIATPQGETGPYTIEWDNGTDDFGQFGLGGGTHAYTLTDAFGCQIAGSEFLPAPAPITLSAVSQPTLCSSDASGQISLTAMGGTGGLTPVWSPNPNNQTGFQLTQIPAGVYNVTVSDANGCAVSGQYSVAAGTDIDVDFAVTDAGCTGSATGAITATPVGTAGNVTYNWDNGMTGATIGGLTAGEYTVTATDANGCTVTATATVFAGAPISFTPTITDITCFGQTNGSINLNVENPDGLEFMWSPNVGAQGGTSLTDLAAGIYFLTVTDGNDCPSYAEYVIEEPNELILTSSATAPGCMGGSNGQINLTAFGGTPGGDCAYTFQTSPALTAADCSNFTGASAGIYQVIATDANGCQVTAEVTVGDGPALYTDWPDTEITNVNCFGGTDGGIDLNIDGTGGLVFDWSENAGGQSGTLLTDLTADTYTLTVTDEQGCFGVSTYTVEEPNAITLTTEVQNVSCADGTDGSLTVNAAGGTPGGGDCPYDYAVSPELTAAGCGIFTDAAAGTYLLTATDAAGCTQSAEFAVTEGALLTAEAAITDATCFGASNGTAEIAVTGGQAPYSYTGDTENLGAGDYSVTVTDNAGCTTEIGFTIEEPETVTFDTDIISAATTGSTDGALVLDNVTGGTPPYTFMWSTGATTQNLTDIPAGDYNLMIEDAAGCLYGFGFTVDALTSVHDLTAQGITVTVRPTLLQPGTDITFLLHSPAPERVNLRLTDALGRTLLYREVRLPAGENHLTLPTDKLPAGVYVVNFSVVGKGRMTERVTVE